jgi:hypothetical protein
MLTDDLDSALARSTTPKVDAELARMARDAERISRPSFLGRFGRRGATFVIAGILLAGGGTAAAATSDLWRPVGWKSGKVVALPNGTRCQVGFQVAVNGDGTPIMDPASVAARRYLKTLPSSMLTPDVTSSADCASQGAEISEKISAKLFAYLKAEGYGKGHLWTADFALWDPKR